jgi:SHS2 domain-containing protein
MRQPPPGTRPLFHEIDHTADRGIVIVVVEAARPEEVRGRVRGESFDPRRHELYGEVKAVTYHELAVTRSGAGWQARVIFDV